MVVDDAVVELPVVEVEPETVDSAVVSDDTVVVPNVELSVVDVPVPLVVVLPLLDSVMVAVYESHDVEIPVVATEVEMV